jgi:hypothetical protein
MTLTTKFIARDSTIAAKILWSSLFDTNVNKVLMSIYMTISNYSEIIQKYGIFSF